MFEDTRVVIIGGGVIGCSIAYHLTKMGWSDVVLIEKGQLAGGTTWHAAGLVGQARSSYSATRMLEMSVELYQQLEEEPGESIGWKQTGSMRVASSKDRMQEIHAATTLGRSYGLDMQLLSPREACDLFPLMDPDGVVGANYLPTDGYVDPTMLTNALAKGARNLGARIHRRTCVMDMIVKNGVVTEVVTDKGNVKAEIVVNAAGIWAREIGKMVGVNVPVMAMKHQFLVTEDIPDMPQNLPTMRDPDHLFYCRAEINGLLLGGFERSPSRWSVGNIPPEFGQELFGPDYVQFEPISRLAMKRLPVLGKAGVKQLVHGPIPVTPDGNYLMGQPPGLKNFYVATGFIYGVGAGGGAGKVIADCLVNGDAGLDMWAEDMRRHGGFQASDRFVGDRSCEYFGNHYKLHRPGDQFESARGVRRSPLYQMLKDAGAVYGEKFGWERPNWFAPTGVEPKDIPQFGKPNWFEHVGAEHRAVRERVALIDQASFGKLEVRGSKAFEFLQWLAANKIEGSIGTVTYTALCNERGGIECEVCIVPLGEQRFYLITGSSAVVHHLDWIERHLPADGSVIAYDVTSSKTVINVCGPKSRQVLQKVSEDDFSKEVFGNGCCRQIHIGYAPVLALRMSYVGGLAFELHIPTEYAAYVYELLWEAGQPLAVANVGYRAIDSLRLEKSRRYWSSDVSSRTTPYEAGLGNFVALEKGDFLGREALAKARAKAPTKLLSCFLLEGPIELQGGETILHNGVALGRVTSGGYGYTVGKTIAYGYLPVEHIDKSEYEIEVYAERIPAKLHDGTPM
jgi:sarcosine dehydrogenase